MISLQQAKRLKVGDVLYSVCANNADGTPLRWRVNGKVQTRKRRPDKVRVPVKHGLYSYDYFTESRLDLVSSTEKQAIRHRAK